MNVIAGHQPEFWITVKENGVYPSRVESGSNTDFLEKSFEDSRTNRYYVRKLTNVRFPDSPGKHDLSYDLTDIYDHALMVNISDQPPEGTILSCIRKNRQLFAFCSDTRHSGGTP